MRSLYRGWTSTVLRDVPFSMIYWFNYETLKTILIKQKFNKIQEEAIWKEQKHHKEHLSSWLTFVCGASAGSLAAAITCPLDVVKTYRQIKLGEIELNKNSAKTLNIIKEIYRIKGVPGLFAGNLL